MWRLVYYSFSRVYGDDGPGLVWRCTYLLERSGSTGEGCDLSATCNDLASYQGPFVSVLKFDDEEKRAATGTREEKKFLPLFLDGGFVLSR